MAETRAVGRENIVYQDRGVWQPRGSVAAFGCLGHSQASVTKFREAFHFEDFGIGFEHFEREVGSGLSVSFYKHPAWVSMILKRVFQKQGYGAMKDNTAK